MGFHVEGRLCCEHVAFQSRSYVIGGIDPDFRELLFAAEHAMDALASSGRF